MDILDRLDVIGKKIDEALEQSGETYLENEKDRWERGEYAYLLEEGLADEYLSDLLANGRCEDELQDILEKLKSIDLGVKAFEIILKENHFNCQTDHDSYCRPFINTFKSFCSMESLDQIDKDDLINIIKHVISDDEFTFLIYALSNDLDSERFVYEIERDDLSRCLLGDDKFFSITYNCGVFNAFFCVNQDDDELLKKLTKLYNDNKPEVKEDKVLVLDDEYEYQELCNDNYGFCTHCGEINESFHEPDARNYKCDYCDENTSYGIQECLIMDKIKFKK